MIVLYGFVRVGACVILLSNCHSVRSEEFDIFYRTLKVIYITLFIMSTNLLG